MKEYFAKDIRNVGVFGHGGEGKTSLTEAMLFNAGLLERLGKVENGTRRDVWNYIDEAFPSGRFLTGICFGSDGGWTAWPPHEHGKEREELYVYFGMGQGFGVQCVYDEFDTANAYVVQDGHLVSIPHGYHPNCGCPSGGLRYVYCMVSTTEGDREFMNLRTQKIFGDKLE